MNKLIQKFRQLYKIKVLQNERVLVHNLHNIILRTRVAITHRYYGILVVFGSFLMGFVFSQWTGSVHFRYSGEVLYETEYSRLLQLIYDSTMNTTLRPHSVLLIDKGLQRGLTSFEHLQLVQNCHYQQLKYHGEYIANLKAVN